MKTQFKISYTIQKRVTKIIEVDSEDVRYRSTLWSRAHKEALARARADAECAGELYEARDPQVLEQLSGRWVYGGQWYMDRGSPSDVIVFEPAHGHLFSTDEIALLIGRINSHAGLAVVDHWNGAGCSTASFRVEGRNGFDEIPDEVLDRWCAPRPWINE